MFAKYRVAAAVIAAIAPCLCGSAAAREEVPYLFASDLAKYCAAADQTIDNALCVWFVMGALEGHRQQSGLWAFRLPAAHD
jgi:hypothetical protein